MGRFRQDLIVSVRRLRRAPGFTLAAVITLALGIGANTTIFTAVNAILFRPLPVARPSELVALNTHLAKADYPVQSLPNYRDIRDRNDVFSGLITYGIAQISMSLGSGNNSLAYGYLVSGNYFDVLGVGPSRGRVLHPDDDRNRNGHPVAVISFGCWQRRFGGDPDVTSRTVKLNGRDYTIVGVTPKGFAGTEVIFTPDIWVPMAMLSQIQPGAGDAQDDRRNFSYFVIGRLKPGVTSARAEAALNVIGGQLGREYPEANEGLQMRLSRPGLFGQYFRGATTAFAGVLMALSAVVLLIASVNLAGMLLARASDRRKETAIRLAIGASRGQLVRQLLTESVLLSALGGVCGVLLATWLTALFGLWRPPVDIPIIPEFSVDAGALWFAAGVSVLTGFLFGLGPALRSTRGNLAPALKNEVVGERLRSLPMRDILVAAQVAMSVLLLVGSVLVVRSLQHALNVPLGFEPRHAASVSMDLDLQNYDETRGREFRRRLIDKVRSLPGIESAALANTMPLNLDINNNSIFIEGQPRPKAADVPQAAMYRAAPGYFHTMQTRLVAGREFDERDQPSSRRVVIVNEAFVRQLLPNQNPIGKRFRYSATEGEWQEIVGVVADGKYRSLGEQPLAAVFQSFQGYSGSLTVIGRSSLSEHAVVGLLRRAVADLDSNITLSTAGSLTDQLGLVLFPARITASVLSAFGLLALILASTGIYAVMAYAVARRTREIGIRMALGASWVQVVRAVLGRGAMLLSIGTVVGIAAALAAGRLFAPILYGVSSTDPATYSLALGLMFVVAFAACWLPARKAVRIDPSRSLRSE